MQSFVIRSFRASSSFAAIAFLLANPAFAQTTEVPPTSEQVPPASDPAGASQTSANEPTEVVVTGFRSSLARALADKRKETAAIDTIVAEDIGKFPDSNLAESMQRVPGVSLSRGDGGEGRNISVRGLGAQFTRVRINGMEGSSQTGSSDIYGAGNSGRSFDFNVFPSEIFSSLTVRKTPSADVEEGSLGATVDLKAPHPLDYKDDFVFSATGRGVYNNISKKVDPRFSALVAKSFADGRFGILGSLAFQKRHIREVGYSAVDILSASLGGNGLDPDRVSATVNGPSPVQPFCTPIGYIYPSPSPTIPANGASRGATATMCSTNNPRTGTLAAYNTIMGLFDPSAPTTPGSGAFFPRIPRYVNSEQNNKRIGGSLTFQFKPTDNTDISIDTLYSRYDVTRRDNYIAGLSFARNINNNGQPMVSVRDIEFDEHGSLIYGVFDGVDVRSEGLVDHFVSTFKQMNLNFEHRFSDRFHISGMLGASNSLWNGKERLQTFIDAIDTDNFVIDYRDGKSTPIVGFGFDVDKPANFSYAPSLSDGTVLGGFSTQGKPSRNETSNQLAELNGTWSFGEALNLKGGVQYRTSDYQARGAILYTGQGTTRALPAGTTLADLTTHIEGLDGLFGRGAPSSWVAIDADKWREAFGFPDKFNFCITPACGIGVSQVKERVKSAYAMATFNTGNALPFPIRGDIGVRYVKTDLTSVGYLQQTLATSPTGVTAVRNEVQRSYKDWLPSANVVVEFTPKLLGRISAAKVMARPELGPLIPSSASVTATTRTGSSNNPYLDPIRAKTFDAALEWYFAPGSLLSVAYYYKDIKTFIQNDNRKIPFNEIVPRLPDALLNGTNSVPTDLFDIRQPVNTPGGPLKGFEINAQVPFRFLPGFWSHFGMLASANRVKSKINYIVYVSGVRTTYTADLVGLSQKSASGTLYYEDDRFSIRGTASYRGPYIRGIIGLNGNDYQGNRANTFVDGSASYKLTNQAKLILEVQNLTDARNSLFIDSERQDTLFETRIGRTINFGVNFKL
ncbi:MAG: TonB-dependent receptor [Sphingomicrobium sp.]